MQFRHLLFFAFSCFIVFSKTFAQKSAPELFLDFDIDSLKGKDRLSDLQGLDSFQKYLGLKYDKYGRPNKLMVFEKNVKGYRTGTFINKSYGTVIGFKTLKTDGYERVIIFGDKDYLFDSILIKKDTVVGRHIEDSYMSITACWKKSKDTIVLKEYYYNWRGAEFYPKSYFITLRNYQEYFTSWLFNSARTTQIIRTGEGYQVEFMDADDKKLSEYNKGRFQNYAKQWGHSLFWLVVASQVFVD